MTRNQRELQAADSCEEALRQIYVSDYERSNSPCNCRVFGNQTIVECSQYSYCKECVADDGLQEQLCGVQSNRFVSGVSVEYCVKFEAMGVESNVCLTKSQRDESCQLTVDDNQCKSCRPVSCDDGSTDTELDCSNLANEWVSDPICQGKKPYNPVAGFTGAVLSFTACYVDPTDTVVVPAGAPPIKLQTEKPVALPIGTTPPSVYVPIVEATPPATVPSTTSAPQAVASEGSTVRQIDEKRSLHPGAIAGVMISCVSIIGLLYSVFWLFLRRRGRDEVPKRLSNQLCVLSTGRSSQQTDNRQNNQAMIDTSSCSEKW